MSGLWRVGDNRFHIPSALRAESLQRRDVLSATDGADRKILPGVPLTYIAGCMFDGGAEPLLSVAVTLWDSPSVVAVGSGARGHHVAKIAKDAGCPTGLIAQVVCSCEEMNATILAALLGPRGVPLPRDHIWDLAYLLRIGFVPILLASPPYSNWEPPCDGGMPVNGPNEGVTRLAAAFSLDVLAHVHAPGCGGECE